MLTAVVVLSSFFALMILGMPIAYSMLVTSFITIKFFHAEIPTIIIPQRMFAGVNNYILLCIPFFMLAGELMGLTPLFNKLINLSKALVGHIKGGLSHVNIVVSMFFAGITGAAVADTATVGPILIPAMVKEGYTKSYSTAVTASSSTLGVIIPPSNLMVVAALATGTSVAALFMGGIIPGILSGLSQLGVSLYYAKKKGFPASENYGLRERARIFWEGMPAIGIPFIIMGGILGGIVTPTEAANITILYAVVVGFIFMRSRPPLAAVYRSLVLVTQRLGAVMFALAGAMVLGWLFAIVQVPDAIGRFILSITTNPILITLGMLGTFLVIGTFLDPLPAILIFTPIFLPIAETIGMGTIHFAVVMVFGFAVGLITPPVGSCLYVAAVVSGLKVEEFVWDLIPFVLAISVILVLIAFVPSLVTWIPSLLLN